MANCVIISQLEADARGTITGFGSLTLAKVLFVLFDDPCFGPEELNSTEGRIQFSSSLFAEMAGPVRQTIFRTVHSADLSSSLVELG